VTHDGLDTLVELVAERVATRVLADIAAQAPASLAGESWRLLDVDEVADMLGRSPRQVHTYAKERGLPYVRLDGGALAFDPEDVKAWARARRVPAAEDDPLAERWHGGREAAPQAGSGNGARTAMQKGSCLGGATVSAELERQGSQGPGHGGPARGYSWPPFEKGNAAAVKHGAFSAQAREPVAREIVRVTLAEPSVSYLGDASYAAAIWAWANSEAELLLLRAWLDEHGWLDEQGEERPPARLLNRVEHRAMRHRDALGLTPSARARIFRDASIGKRVGLSLVDFTKGEHDPEGQAA
jgi:predicted DNA-binding transcriptional regulator AlpA